MRGPLDPLDPATVFLSPWWPSMQMGHVSTVYELMVCMRWRPFGFDALRKRAGKLSKNRVCRAAEVQVQYAAVGLQNHNKVEKS